MAKGGVGNKGKAKAKLRPRARSRTRAEKPKLMEDPAMDKRILDHQLKAMGLYAANTLGDGNCLFRALSDQLYGNPNHHLALRHQCCEFLATQSDRFRLFVDEDSVPGGFEGHVASMRIPGTYGTHIELSALANLFKRPIKVVQPGLIYVIKSDDNEEFQDEVDSELVEQPLIVEDADDQEGESLSSRERRQILRGIKGKGKRSTVIVETPTEDENGPLYIVYHAWEHYSSLRNLDGPHSGLPNVREIPLPPPPDVTQTITPPSPIASATVALLAPETEFPPSDDEIPPNPNHAFPLHVPPPASPSPPLSRQTAHPPSSVPSKRGRGRPRKYPLAVGAVEGSSTLPTPPSSDIDPSSSQLSLPLPSSLIPITIVPTAFHLTHHNPLLRAHTPTSASLSDEEPIRENSRTRMARLQSPGGSSSNAASTPVASASSGSRSDASDAEEDDDEEITGRKKPTREKGGTTRVTLKEKRELREAEKKRRAELRRSTRVVGGGQIPTGTRKSTRAGAGQRANVGSSTLGEGVRTLFI